MRPVEQVLDLYIYSKGWIRICGFPKLRLILIRDKIQRILIPEKKILDNPIVGLPDDLDGVSSGPVSGSHVTVTLKPKQNCQKPLAHNA